MREILFRGKTIKQNNGVTTEKPIKENMWVYGNLTVGKIEGYKCDMISNKHEIYYINPETIGQFTGLTDKNGKKIFEGDIVEITWKGNIICMGDIRYDEASCRFVIYEDYVFPYGFDNTNTFEVIGNIYDNPKPLGE